MIYDCYLWLMEMFFSTESLPPILQPISEELCAVASILIVLAILAIPIYLIYRLARFMFEVRL